MSLPGHVHNGVVVFDAGVSLPEGTKVTIAPSPSEPDQIRAGSGDWEGAAKAAQALRDTGYDFDARQRQRACDLQHAADHLP